MKTSEEIAGEMAVQTSMIWMARENVGIPESIIESIPLAQLIEVARAAKQFASADPGDSLTAFIVLEDAIVKLEATGKAEWL